MTAFRQANCESETIYNTAEQGHDSRIFGPVLVFRIHLGLSPKTGVGSENRPRCVHGHCIHSILRMILTGSWGYGNRSPSEG